MDIKVNKIQLRKNLLTKWDLDNGNYGDYVTSDANGYPISSPWTDNQPWVDNPIWYYDPSIDGNLPQSSYIEGYWKLDEARSGTRYDSSLRHNDLYETHDDLPVGYSAAGVSGNCAVFTNASIFEGPEWVRYWEYLIREYANCNGLKGGTGFSIKLWFNPTDPQTGVGELIGKGGAPPAAPATYSYYVYWNYTVGTVQFSVTSDGGVHTSTVLSQALTTGAWHEIWCVFDGVNQEMHIYADGTKNTEVGTIASAHNEDFYDLRMGSGYTGKIDQVVFWNKVLTDDDIL